MIENLYFLHQTWLWPVLFSGFVLWLLFVWKENPRKPNIRFFVNSLVALIAISSLVLIILKPVSSRTMETKAGALLTSDYNEERLDSLRLIYKGLKVIPYDKNRGIEKKLDSISLLYVLGDGVWPFDFWQFDSVPAQYLESSMPEGIVALNYNQVTTEGESLVIGLQFNASVNALENRHCLVLADPGGTGLDSVALNRKSLDSATSNPLDVSPADLDSSNSDSTAVNPATSNSIAWNSSMQTNFSLSTQMKVKGNYVFSLLEKDSTGKTIKSEPVPVTVLSKTPLKILLVNSFPTFESKYLKNYLAEMGHEVTVRSQLTKGKYRFEYFNTNRDPIYTFSKKLFEAFDMLIIDSNNYLNLSQTSKKALKEAVAKEGLGVFVQPDNQFFSVTKSKSNFDFERDGNTETGLKGWPKLKVEKYPFHFKSSIGLENIQINNQEILTAYKRTEKGRIGTTLIRNTYKWILDGQTETFQQFWSAIVSATAKRQDVSTIWQPKTKIVYQNMPYNFDLRTTYDRPELKGPEGVEVPIKQNPDILQLWTGIVYPRTTGWNELRIQNDSTSTHRFFVMDSTDFQALNRYGIQQANQRFFEDSSSITQRKSVSRPISGLWFFVVFLMAMGWLWLSPKILRH